MKLLLLLSLFILGTISISQGSFLINDAFAQSDQVVPPHHQMRMINNPSQVMCSPDMVLMMQDSNGMPTCVTPQSYLRLADRGWGNFDWNLLSEHPHQMQGVMMNMMNNPQMWQHMTAHPHMTDMMQRHGMMMGHGMGQGMMMGGGGPGNCPMCPTGESPRDSQIPQTAACPWCPVSNQWMMHNPQHMQNMMNQMIDNPQLRQQMIDTMLEMQQQQTQKQKPVSSTVTGDENTKSFDVTAFQWGFEPQFIKVDQGDRVILKITSIDVTHGFALDEFGINEPLNVGKIATIDFVADKVGTFGFYCSIMCGAGHNEQRGFLIVNDPSQLEPEPTRVIAPRSQTEITLDGNSDDWNDVPESMFMTAFDDEGRKINVKSQTFDGNLYLLMRWQDNDANNDASTHSDRMSVGFDISGDSDIAMGAAGVPHVKVAQRTIGEGVVDIWHWKAYDTHTESPDKIDDEFAGPFEQLKEHYYRDDDDKYGGNNEVSSASSYNEITKEWIVEVSRPLVTLDVDVEGFGPIDKQFSLGESYKIAFAVWDGGKGEIGGMHKATDWGILVLEK